MMKVKMLAAVVAAASIVGAQEPQNIFAVDADRANADIKVKVRSARSELKNAFAEFARAVGISYGVPTQDGRIYCRGQAAVNADYSSPQFIKSRAMAYERAYLDAIARFMIDSYGRETTKKVSELYDDQSEGSREMPATKSKNLAEKVALLADAKLNAALADSGVPPEKYAEASVIEKRKLLHDAIAVETMHKVLHASSGCIPVKTFESRGDDGRYCIGVVVRYDKTSMTLAKCFRQKVRPAISCQHGLAINDALPQEDEMTSNFGVRLYYDETGTPSLLSFGQWGCDYAGKSAAKAERAEAQAVNQARMLADSGLTSFINSFVDAAETGDVSETVFEGINFTDDGNATPEDFTRIADLYRKSIKLTGSDTMLGRSTVYDEILMHPNGHKVAVVVRRWSFGMVDAVDAFIKGKMRESGETKPAAAKEGSGVREGRTYDF